MLGPPENEQLRTHLGSTIKFPAAPETGEFDSDGLFEDSLNDRNSSSPPKASADHNAAKGPAPFLLGLKQTSNQLQQKSQYAN